MTEPSRDLEAGEGNEADVEDVEDTEDTRKAKLTADLMKDPKVLAALQSKLGIMVGASSGYIENLPACVKRRIKALKKLHVECSKVEAKFHAEVYALECKYAKLYQPFYDKRHQITVGKVEPTDEECDFTTDSDKEEDEISGIKKAAINEKGDEKKDENVAGIPEFWLTALKNLDLMVDMIQEHDEEILKHLIDIKVRNLEPNSMGFVLEFHFEPNEFFNNTVLTKSYEVKCEVDDAEPLAFEGPDIVGCKGCVIEWKKGKNVTVKTMKKKQKHKSRGTVRFVTKTMQRDSFFNFFSPPEQQGDTLDEETQALLAADFEIGHMLKERVVPRAVLYFTGEAIQEDDYDEDEEDEEDEEEDDDEHNEDFDEDDDADPDFVPKSTKKGEPPAECKQQ